MHPQGFNFVVLEDACTTSLKFTDTHFTGIFTIELSKGWGCAFQSTLHPLLILGLDASLC
jgi:hypothetical protein